MLNFFSSSTGMRSSSVAMRFGSAARDFSIEKLFRSIAHRRTAAYIASSYPKYLSLKKMCPLTSPAMSAFFFMIWCFMLACPVGTSIGLPPICFILRIISGDVLMSHSIVGFCILLFFVLICCIRSSAKISSSWSPFSNFEFCFFSEDLSGSITSNRSASPSKARAILAFCFTISFCKTFSALGIAGSGGLSLK